MTNMKRVHPDEDNALAISPTGAAILLEQSRFIVWFPDLPKAEITRGTAENLMLHGDFKPTKTGKDFLLRA